MSVLFKIVLSVTKRKVGVGLVNSNALRYSYSFFYRLVHLGMLENYRYLYNSLVYVGYCFLRTGASLGPRTVSLRFLIFIVPPCRRRR